MQSVKLDKTWNRQLNEIKYPYVNITNKPLANTITE